MKNTYASLIWTTKNPHKKIHTSEKLKHTKINIHMVEDGQRVSQRHLAMQTTIMNLVGEAGIYCLTRVYTKQTNTYASIHTSIHGKDKDGDEETCKRSQRFTCSVQFFAVR